MTETDIVTIQQEAIDMPRDDDVRRIVPIPSGVWLPAEDAPRGVRALIRYKSGLMDFAYKTNNGEPFLETWRYSGTACSGEQCPWPEAYMVVEYVKEN